MVAWGGVEQEIMTETYARQMVSRLLLIAAWTYALDRPFIAATTMYILKYLYMYSIKYNNCY